MKKINKISILGASLAILAANSAIADEKTLVEYLNEREVSYLIVISNLDVRISTFGWEDAVDSCKNLTEAGYSVNHIRNFSTKTLNETEMDCVQN